MSGWVKKGLLALLPGLALIAQAQAELPRHGYERAGSGRSDSGVRWVLGSRAGSAPCLRLSLGAPAKPRAWDCYADYLTAVGVYADCERDEAYVYGPVPRRVVRVVAIYNFNRARRASVLRPDDRSGRMYLATLSHLRDLRHVRAYSRGGHLVDDIRVGFSDTCR